MQERIQEDCFEERTCNIPAYIGYNTYYQLLNINYIKSDFERQQNVMRENNVNTLLYL